MPRSVLRAEAAPQRETVKRRVRALVRPRRIHGRWFAPPRDTVCGHLGVRDGLDALADGVAEHSEHSCVRGVVQPAVVDGRSVCVIHQLFLAYG